MILPQLLHLGYEAPVLKKSQTLHIDYRFIEQIFIGGSYPGMRAAFVREKYPETIFASFASSAPVQAQVDMSIYFEQIYRGLNAFGFSNCTADIHAAVNYIDDRLASPVSAAAIKKAFLGKGADKNSNEGLADVLTYIFYSFQSYELEGTPG